MNILSACMSVSHVHAWCLRDQKRELDPLEPELQTVVSHMWVLGMDLGPLKEQDMPLAAESFSRLPLPLLDFIRGQNKPSLPSVDPLRFIHFISCV